jgi:hypothetical protein
MWELLGFWKDMNVIAKNQFLTSIFVYIFKIKKSKKYIFSTNLSIFLFLFNFCLQEILKT